MRITSMLLSQLVFSHQSSGNYSTTAKCAQNSNRQSTKGLKTTPADRAERILPNEYLRGKCFISSSAMLRTQSGPSPRSENMAQLIWFKLSFGKPMQREETANVIALVKYPSCRTRYASASKANERRSKIPKKTSWHISDAKLVFPNWQINFG